MPRKSKLQLQREREQAQVMARLTGLDQTPFREELARWMGCAPDEESLRKWAAEEPGRWAQGLRFLGTLGGFHEKLIKEQNNTVIITQMSDAEIDMRLKDLRRRLLDEDIVDGELVADPGGADGGQDGDSGAGGAEGV